MDKCATELKTFWSHPDFDAGQAALYYVRVLENPSCRWSTWDSITIGESPPANVPATIQERAWTAPIWYGAEPSMKTLDREKTAG